MTTALFVVADVRDALAAMPDDSVDLIMTSPPFLALRSYLPADHPDKTREIGAEPDPATFVDTLLELTAEWGRVLAPHGSIVVELGDTYAGTGGGGGDYLPGGWREGQQQFAGSGASMRESNAAHWRQKNRKRTRTHNLYNLYNTATRYSDDWNKGNTAGKAIEGVPIAGGPGWPLAKSLCGIPWLYTLSLAYGRNLLTGQPSPAGQWIVRNVIAWCRPNPPVGALGDKFRPATSYLTVATRSPRRWFDLDAVREPVKHPNARASHLTGKDVERRGSLAPYTGDMSAGAPPLDYWEIATEPYVGAHYATFPEALCVRPIKSMCPQRVCTTCGEPSRRIVKRSGRYAQARAVIGDFNQRTRDRGQGVSGSRSVLSAAAGADMTCAENVTIGWTDCGHDTWRTGRVFDPFAGTGTTLAVATGCGRDAIGVDIDARNLELAVNRVGPLFLTQASIEEAALWLKGAQP